MTLNDLLKRVTEDDKNKVLILSDYKGWTNVQVAITDTTIVISPDITMPFND